MSFYYDDDDDDDDASHDNNNFLSRSCPNCGSTDNYKDSTTGALVCASCYTQSQAHTQEEMDVDEVQALAARNQSGQIMGIRKRRNKGTFVKVSLDEWDTSTPFPSLETCLEGYKVVLQVSTNVLCDLLDLDKETAASVHDRVKTIWFSFLKTWKEGADFYGKLHPEVRFCLRDAFINLAPHRAQILRYLSYEAMKKINQEIDDAGENQDNDEQDTNGTQINTGTAVNILEMLDLYKRKGRLEAALRTKPSMTQVASVLLLATYRLGIAGHHVITWIANGKLPLLNAFQNCLTKELQEKLHHIAYFFRLESIPSIYQVEYQAKLLLITSRKQDDVSPTSLITPTSIPILMTRLVMELGFRQQVLDNALALMGQYRGPPRYWLPKPLVRLNIKDIRHILGVLVVAVKMCPDWQSWKYYRCSPEMPWNDAMAQQLRNSHLNSYLDFCDRNGRVDATGSIMPEFTNRLQVIDDKDRSSESFPILIAGAPNPNQPLNMDRRQKHHDFFLRVRKSRAVWADANGLGMYILYDKKDEKQEDISDLHPQYLLLLEHIARTCFVTQIEVHNIVVRLDEEVQMLGRDIEAIKTTPYKKRWREIMTSQQRIAQLFEQVASKPSTSKGAVRTRRADSTRTETRKSETQKRKSTLLSTKKVAAKKKKKAVGIRRSVKGKLRDSGVQRKPDDSSDSDTLLISLKRNKFRKENVVEV